MTMIERIILESLGKKPRSLTDLLRDTGLREKVLVNTLALMMKSQIVLAQEGRFQLDPTLVAKLSKDKRHEVKELMGGIVDQYFDNKGSTISLKKVWMTKGDEKMFEGMLSNVDHFLNELKVCNSRSGRPLWEKKVFYWGMAPYRNALEGQFKLI